jgi:MoxR-like ATPase
MTGGARTPDGGSPPDLPFRTVHEVEEAFRRRSYIADEGLATAILLALMMGRPLLLEGEAGVGKTEVAKTLAPVLGAELIRLQCYEGIDAAQALYEWDYGRQLLFARALQDGEVAPEQRVAQLYGPDFLLERPLLKAIRAGPRAVLLIDEIDRADEEFEAFLLEVLSENAVSIPELGTIGAETPPAVILTSNRTRELHDALKRRCLYHWIDYPDLKREVEIIRLRVPGASESLARSIATAIAKLRALDLIKSPGAAEAIDWAKALTMLGKDALDHQSGRITLGLAIKNHDDLRRVQPLLDELIDD